MNTPQEANINDQLNSLRDSLELLRGALVTLTESIQAAPSLATKTPAQNIPILSTLLSPSFSKQKLSTGLRDRAAATQENQNQSEEQQEGRDAAAEPTATNVNAAASQLEKLARYDQWAEEIIGWINDASGAMASGQVESVREHVQRHLPEIRQRLVHIESRLNDFRTNVDIAEAELGKKNSNFIGYLSRAFDFKASRFGSLTHVKKYRPTSYDDELTGTVVKVDSTKVLKTNRTRYKPTDNQPARPREKTARKINYLYVETPSDTPAFRRTVYRVNADGFNRTPRVREGQSLTIGKEGIPESKETIRGYKLTKHDLKRDKRAVKKKINQDEKALKQAIRRADLNTANQGTGGSEENAQGSSQIPAVPQESGEDPSQTVARTQQTPFSLRVDLDAHQRRLAQIRREIKQLKAGGPFNFRAASTATAAQRLASETRRLMPVDLQVPHTGKEKAEDRDESRTATTSNLLTSSDAEPQRPSSSKLKTHAIGALPETAISGPIIPTDKPTLTEDEEAALDKPSPPQASAINTTIETTPSLTMSSERQLETQINVPSSQRLAKHSNTSDTHIPIDEVPRRSVRSIKKAIPIPTRQLVDIPSSASSARQEERAEFQFTRHLSTEDEVVKAKAPSVFRQEPPTPSHVSIPAPSLTALKEPDVDAQSTSSAETQPDFDREQRRREKRSEYARDEAPVDLTTVTDLDPFNDETYRAEDQDPTLSRKSVDELYGISEPELAPDNIVRMRKIEAILCDRSKSPEAILMAIGEIDNAYLDRPFHAWSFGDGLRELRKYSLKQIKQMKLSPNAINTQERQLQSRHGLALSRYRDIKRFQERRNYLLWVESQNESSQVTSQIPRTVRKERDKFYADENKELAWIGAYADAVKSIFPNEHVLQNIAFSERIMEESEQAYRTVLRTNESAFVIQSLGGISAPGIREKRQLRNLWNATESHKAYLAMTQALQQEFANPSVTQLGHEKEFLKQILRCMELDIGFGKRCIRLFLDENRQPRSLSEAWAEVKAVGREEIPQILAKQSESKPTPETTKVDKLSVSDSISEEEHASLSLDHSSDDGVGLLSSPKKESQASTSMARPQAPRGSIALTALQVARIRHLLSQRNSAENHLAGIGEYLDYQGWLGSLDLPKKLRKANDEALVGLSGDAKRAQKELNKVIESNYFDAQRLMAHRTHHLWGSMQTRTSAISEKKGFIEDKYKYFLRAGDKKDRALAWVGSFRRSMNALFPSLSQFPQQIALVESELLKAADTDLSKVTELNTPLVPSGYSSTVRRDYLNSSLNYRTLLATISAFEYEQKNPSVDRLDRVVIENILQAIVANLPAARNDYRYGNIASKRNVQPLLQFMGSFLSDLREPISFAQALPKLKQIYPEHWENTYTQVPSSPEGQLIDFSSTTSTISSRSKNVVTADPESIAHPLLDSSSTASQASDFRIGDDNSIDDYPLRLPTDLTRAGEDLSHINADIQYTPSEVDQVSTEYAPPSSITPEAASVVDEEESATAAFFKARGKQDLYSQLASAIEDLDDNIMQIGNPEPRNEPLFVQGYSRQVTRNGQTYMSFDNDNAIDPVDKLAGAAQPSFHTIMNNGGPASRNARLSVHHYGNHYDQMRKLVEDQFGTTIDPEGRKVLTEFGALMQLTIFENSRPNSLVSSTSRQLSRIPGVFDHSAINTADNLRFITKACIAALAADPDFTRFQAAWNQKEDQEERQLHMVAKPLYKALALNSPNLVSENESARRTTKARDMIEETVKFALFAGTFTLSHLADVGIKKVTLRDPLKRKILREINVDFVTSSLPGKKSEAPTTTQKTKVQTTDYISNGGEIPRGTIGVAHDEVMGMLQLYNVNSKESITITEGQAREVGMFHRYLADIEESFYKDFQANKLSSGAVGVLSNRKSYNVPKDMPNLGIGRGRRKAELEHHSSQQSERRNSVRR